jgi:class 3 adenylate cyclase
MASGRTAEAVRDLHVLRSEMNAVLQEDFSGRKVRFIGDCIHGLIAEGDQSSTDSRRSVELATACVGALRSSFDLCRGMLPSARALGLAIGFELGATPISRIGIRGERAVRVASSRATLTSELCQSVCSGTETKIGEAAFAAASADTQRLFVSDYKAAGLDFDKVLLQSTPAAAAAGEVAEPVTDNRSYLDH